MTVKPLVRKKEQDETDEEKKDDTKEEIEEQTQDIDKVPDHTHPEYDQLLIKIQELETRISNLESDTDVDITEKKEQVEEIPERETSLKKKKIGPEGTSEVPQTEQPDVGKAPGEDLHKKIKVSPKINKLEEEDDDEEEEEDEELEEQTSDEEDKEQKKLKEQDEDDPTQPKPGKTTKEPKAMNVSSEDLKPNNTVIDENLTTRQTIEGMYAENLTMKEYRKVTDKKVNDVVKEYLAKSRISLT